jgi:hypothetical protein
MGKIIRNVFLFWKCVDVAVAGLTALCRNLAGGGNDKVYTFQIQLKPDFQLINKLKNIKCLQVSNTTIIIAIVIIVIIIIVYGQDITLEFVMHFSVNICIHTI